MNTPDEFGLFPFQRFTADELRHFFVWCAAHKVSDVDLTGGSPVSVSRFGRRVRCSSATLPTTLMSSLIDELFGREVIPRVLAGNPVDRTIQIPVLGVFRVKSGTLARILKFTVGPLELWALNSSPKDSALRKTLTNKLGSVRARKILAENFPRGSATSLIEHRAGQHNSDNVIEDLASELIRKQGYNL